MPDRDFRLKDGKWFPVMHELSDALVRQKLSGAEFALAHFVMRWAYSFRHPYADLRWKFIRDETNIPDATLSRALNGLIERNILRTSKNGSKIYTRYRINSKISTWKMPKRRKNTSKNGSKTLPKMEVHPLKKEYKENIITPPIAPPTEIKNNFDQARLVIDFINDLSGKNFPYSESTMSPIVDRLAEGHTIEQCFQSLQE